MQDNKTQSPNNTQILKRAYQAVDEKMSKRAPLKFVISVFLVSYFMVLSIMAGYAKEGIMKLISPEFKHNQMIPKKFTCQGQDINPALEITDIPEGAKTLVLISDDPDAPGGTWDHWIVFNISPAAGIKEDSVPGTQGKNSWGRSEYGGPCPPSGTHRYFFKLYALDTMLDLPKGASKAQVERAMEGHILDEAELIGLYKKG